MISIVHDFVLCIPFQEVVDNLYSFRDHYFEKFPLEKAIEKNEDVKQEKMKTLEVLESLKGNI